MRVLPACAGVIPRVGTVVVHVDGFTRMRGGDPAIIRTYITVL